MIKAGKTIDMLSPFCPSEPSQ